MPCHPTLVLSVIHRSDLQLAQHRRGDVNEGHQIAQLFTTRRMLNDLVD
jgi:hypothetical protein